MQLKRLVHREKGCADRGCAAPEQRRRRYLLRRRGAAEAVRLERVDEQRVLALVLRHAVQPVVGAAARRRWRRGGQVELAAAHEQRLPHVPAQHAALLRRHLTRGIARHVDAAAAPRVERLGDPQASAAAIAIAASPRKCFVRDFVQQIGGQKSFNFLTYSQKIAIIFHNRSYHDENTASRPICEVKHHRAQSVLGWGTTWEA